MIDPTNMLVEIEFLQQRLKDANNYIAQLLLQNYENVSEELKMRTELSEKIIELEFKLKLLGVKE